MTDNKSLNDMTRDELRAIAKELDIAGRGNMRKPELVEAIAHARAEQIKTNVNARKVREETEAQISVYAEEAHGIANALEEATSALGHDVHQFIETVQPSLPKPMPRKMREALRRKPERGMINGQPMPLHYRGRAMGAKHYPTPRSVMAAFTPAKKAPVQPVGYDSREDAYREQLGAYRRGYNLTPKQERRLRHKSNHHNAVMADPR